MKCLSFKSNFTFMNILEFEKKKKNVQLNIKIIMDTCDPNPKEILKLKANKF